MDFIKSSNEERLFNSIYAIGSFSELKMFLKWQWKIGESSLEDLIYAIEKIENWEIDNFNEITRKAWLRNKVALLKNNILIENNSTLKKLWPKWFRLSEHLTEQWTVWNCYFVAALNSLKNHPKWWKMLSDMIKELPWWKWWEVKFKWYEKAIKVTLEDLLDMWTDAINNINWKENINIWDNIIERAYNHLVNIQRWWEDGMTQIARKYWKEKNKLIYAGGQNNDVYDIFFWSDIKIFYAQTENWKTAIKTKKWWTLAERWLNKTLEKYLLEKWNNNGLFWLWSKSKSDKITSDVVDYFWKIVNLPNNHAYTVIDLNKDEWWIEIVNPHNSWEILKFKISDIDKYFNSLDIWIFK